VSSFRLSLVFGEVSSQRVIDWTTDIPVRIMFGIDDRRDADKNVQGPNDSTVQEKSRWTIVNA